MEKKQMLKNAVEMIENHKSLTLLIAKLNENNETDLNKKLLITELERDYLLDVIKNILND